MAVYLKDINKDFDSSLFIPNHAISDVPGVKLERREFIKMKEVLLDHDKNSGRIGGYNSSHKEDLKYSFGINIDLSQPLLIVEELDEPYLDKSDGEYKRFQLIDGFNRFNALDELGVDGYYFDVVKVGLDGHKANFCRKTLAGASNAHPPKLNSNENDIWKLVSELISNNDLANDEITIKDYLKTYMKLKGSMLTKVTNLITSTNNTPQTFKLYSKGLLKKGLKALGVVTHGAFDIGRGKHGWSTLEGYDVDTFWNAISKFHEKGEYSYTVGHTKLPDADGVGATREYMEDSFLFRAEQLKSVCEHYKKTGEIPLEFIGFLPQDQHENRNELIPPTKTFTHRFKKLFK